MFAKINKGVVEKYPYSHMDLVRDFPATSFPSPLSADDLIDFDVVIVAASPQPEHNALFSYCIETTPVSIDGSWVQAWEVVPRPFELVMRDFQDAHDAYINAPALARNYDSFATFALRASRAGPWQADGIAFFDWMETCNSIGFGVLAEVNAGTRQPPASIAEYLALLPVCPLDAT